MTVSAADYFWHAPQNGDFGVAANWRLGSTGTDGDAVTPPGESDTVYFCTGEYTISLNNDARIGKLYVENQDSYAERTVHFNLNGHTLTTVDRYIVNGDVSHAAATLTFTNGCVSSEGKILISKEAANAWTGNLILDDVICATTNDIGVMGAWPSLIVRNGSKISCSSLGGRVFQIGETMDIAGAEINARGALHFVGPHRARIHDGTWIHSTNSLFINGYAQDCTVGHRVGGRVVVDHSVITNAGIKTRILLGTAAYDNSGNLGECVLILTNHTVCTGYGYGHVGGRQNETFSCSNRIEIVDGSLLEMNGFEYGTSRTCDGLIVSFSRGSSDNVLYVKDGTYIGRFLRIGNTGATETSCGTNNILHIAGTCPLVKTTAQHNQWNLSMQFASGSILRFDIGRDGYENVPIQVGGTLVASRPEIEPFNTLSNRLEIAARDFDREHPNERLVLIETSRDSAAAFQELIGNSRFSSSHPGTLSIENSGKSLVYTAPKKVGSVIYIQ